MTDYEWRIECVIAEAKRLCQAMADARAHGTCCGAEECSCEFDGGVVDEEALQSAVQDLEHERQLRAIEKKDLTK